ncbi:uncharacterized protein LOC111519312 [Drosophila willistoni]|uniref:uncharacterized protein LOC111519312 n=1 Tax=Drosophila willistoni TaxID=7260 RepID=UPI001F0874E7|nr:uncharacterized protein LOC111519312 [Drosophila willistoni]
MGSPQKIKFGKYMYDLSFFKGISHCTRQEKELFVKKLREKLDTVVRNETEYFLDFDAMAGLKKNLVYSLNIDEVHNHHLLYVHKFFVIFLTCLQDGTQTLVFAESNCQSKSQQLTNSESMATALGRVLRAVRFDARSNLVAIVGDRARLNLKSLDDLSYTFNFAMPPVVFDPTHLIGSFSQQHDMSCCESVTQLMTTNFMKETFSEQVSMIIGQCHCKDTENLCIFWELCAAVQSVLKMVMRHQEQCILMNLKNNNLEIYCKALMKQLPILDMDFCDEGAGLLFLLANDVVANLNKP